MSTPEVSIVLPVHNRAGLVDQSLRSARAQAGVDLEILVVDDGSTDDTPRVLAAHAAEDGRLRVLRTPHRGPAAARNAGMAVARGDYLTFLDSDDLYPPGRVRRQLDKLTGTAGAAAVVGAVLFFEGLDSSGAPLRDERFAPFHNAVLQCATFRASALRELGPLDETLGFAEDVDLFLRLLEIDARLILEPEIACLYRVHAGNMTHDDPAKRQGYVRAYARSLARRRATGRTRPLRSFFHSHIVRETHLGGYALQSLRPMAEPAALRPYLHAFHLSHWRDVTDLSTLWLALEASGPGQVTLRRRRADGSAVTLHDVQLGPESRTLSLDVDTTAGGVIEVGLATGVSVRSGEWMTADPGCREVRLVIVICSFHRPQAVLANLDRLSGHGARAIVVHQGDGSEVEWPHDVEVIRQANLGGAGGFTRGMLEAISHDATHVLLLDDDVEVPPDLVTRLTALLERTVAPVTIGGQMLDSSAPTVLAAAHEHVDLRRLRLRNPLKDTDLAPPAARRLFAEVGASTYNGWWCCCVPVDTLHRVLPLPLFVRHDDVEHGLQTGRAGGRVVTMPGIFVWHEPFETKIKPWYSYYDRRNMLIIGAIHGRASGRRMATVFLRNTGEALYHHRYDICWAAGQAARDFLAGPDDAFGDPRARHELIMAGTARHLLATIRSYQGRRRRRESALRALHRPEVGPPAAAALRDMLGCAWALLVHGGRAAREYRAARERYASPAAWRAYLGMER